jgi:4-aminobutyrate aminotransferase-like enzyme
MENLIADALLSDPLFLETKEKLLQIVEKHRQQIQAVKPAEGKFKAGYEETLHLFQAHKGSPLFYPFLSSGLGNGALVELADGSVKYDLISGIGVHWGHAHPKIVEAALEAAVQDIAMQGHLMQNRQVAELTAQLCELTGLDHCFLSSSGSMANENGLKLAFHRKPAATRILAFEHCFMGQTIALSQITDHPSYREGLPSFLHVDYVPFYDWRDPSRSSARALTTLNNHLQRFPKQHACMCFELVLGAGGNYPGKKEFFQPLMRLLKEREIAILIDEVQTFGRSDHLFAFQHFGLEEYADIVTCGKLLHACATCYREGFRPPVSYLSQTVAVSTASVFISLAILKSLTQEGYLGAEGKNMQLRNHFVSHLNRLAENYPKLLTGPFGHGLMIAITPFQGVKKRVAQFAKALFEAGVIAFIAGENPTRLRFLLPAGSITFKDLDSVAQILEEVLIKNES